MSKLALHLSRLAAVLLLSVPAFAQAPIANDDSVSVCAGSTVEISVLSNDTSATPVFCGSIDIVGLPDVGGVSTSFGCATPLCPAGFCIRYQAPTDFAGTVSIVYEIENVAGTDTATLAITVCKVDAVDDAGSICPGDT